MKIFHLTTSSNNINNLQQEEEDSKKQQPFTFNEIQLAQEFLKKKEKIQFIKSGKEHIILITQNKQVYGYGSNSSGQLGLKDTIKYLQFTKINSFPIYKSKYFKYLECGDNCTIFLNDLNEILFTGHLFFSFHSFNVTKINFIEYFKEEEENQEIKLIKCGSGCLFIVMEDKSVYTIGDNFSGKLGLQNINIIKNFTKIENLNCNVIDIQVGMDHTLMLDNLGNIYSCGSNEYGQLGLEKEIKGCKTFKKINFREKITKIYTTNNSSFILTKYNELFGCGMDICDFNLNGFNRDMKNTFLFTKIFIQNNLDCKIKSFFQLDIEKLIMGASQTYLFAIDEKFNFFIEKSVDLFENVNFNDDDLFEEQKRSGKFINHIGNGYFIITDDKLNVGNSIEMVDESGLLCGLKCLQKNSDVLSDVIFMFN